MTIRCKCRVHLGTGAAAGLIELQPVEVATGMEAGPALLQPIRMVSYDQAVLAQFIHDTEVEVDIIAPDAMAVPAPTPAVAPAPAEVVPTAPPPAPETP